VNVLSPFDINSFVAVGSLTVACLALVTTLVFSRLNYSQSNAFKSVDIEREDIREIREIAAEFLQAASERFGAEDDAKTFMELENSSQFDPDKRVLSANTEKQYPEKLFIYNSLRRSAFIRQGICYEKLRLLLNENDASKAALLNSMVALMKAKNAAEITGVDFSDLVIETILSRQRTIRSKIGQKYARI
jgi:hypothetical protein